MSPLLLVTLALTAAHEDEAASVVRERFERAGRGLPGEDAALSDAARALAQVALERSPGAATGLLAITEAVSRAGGWDANPTAIIVRAPRERLLGELAQHPRLTSEPASDMGVGIAERDGVAALCVLLAGRRFELAAGSRRFSRPPGPVLVCGELVPPLETAELFVTRPGGGVERAPMAKAERGRCATFTAASRGRYVVEVLGRGPRGPEVAALYFVDVGAAEVSALERFVEPPSPADARRAVTTRINALRRTMGLSALAPDPALDAVAQAYADRLATEDFFSHVDPTGGDLKGRLATGRYRFAQAGENLGASSGPLAAHFGIEHSPGHRLNLLEPAYRALGLGLATRPSDNLTVLVEVLANPGAEDDRSPLDTAYRTLAAHRSKKGLPSLERHAALEALAQEHARRCLERDSLSSELSPGRTLHERVFEVVTDAREVSVDVAIIGAASALPSLRNVGDRRFSRVGLGLVRGDSRTYGADKLWVVVVYANRDE
ncbi:MAG: CAP domain-containing protein [Myxococcaceae bacterium]|jgi:uncharacterized protein YkwD|nr:CAP domain-containing protein [Myxococcaceae bacterium]